MTSNGCASDSAGVRARAAPGPAAVPQSVSAVRPASLLSSKQCPHASSSGRRGVMQEAGESSAGPLQRAAGAACKAAQQRRAVQSGATAVRSSGSSAASRGALPQTTAPPRRSRVCPTPHNTTHQRSSTRRPITAGAARIVQLHASAALPTPSTPSLPLNTAARALRPRRAAFCLPQPPSSLQSVLMARLALSLVAAVALVGMAAAAVRPAFLWRRRAAARPPGARSSPLQSQRVRCELQPAIGTTCLQQQRRARARARGASPVQARARRRAPPRAPPHPRTSRDSCPPPSSGPRRPSARGSTAPSTPLLRRSAMTSSYGATRRVRTAWGEEAGRF